METGRSPISNRPAAVPASGRASGASAFWARRASASACLALRARPSRRRPASPGPSRRRTRRPRRGRRTGCRPRVSCAGRRAWAAATGKAEIGRDGTDRKVVHRCDLPFKARLVALGLVLTGLRRPAGLAALLAPEPCHQTHATTQVYRPVRRAPTSAAPDAAFYRPQHRQWLVFWRVPALILAAFARYSAAP